MSWVNLVNSCISGENIYISIFLDWGWDGWNPSQYKVAGKFFSKQKNTFYKTEKSFALRTVKCSFLGCWRSRDRRKFTGRESTRQGFHHFIYHFGFNINFRYLRSPLAVSVMKNVWRCLKIKYKKYIYLYLSISLYQLIKIILNHVFNEVKWIVSVQQLFGVLKEFYGKRG